MTGWDFLIDESAIAAVVPDAYRRYRPAVREALTVFLGGLSSSRQSRLLADQATLGADATPEERLATLARGCPALHKLGQVLARDQRLSPELRGHLQGLESLAPNVSPDVIAATLEDELGPLDRLGVTLRWPALAEASVAVVVPFRDERDQRDGVFKILKPGVAERLQEELQLLGDVGARLDARCNDVAIPRLDYEETFADVRESLLQELRLDLEQRHLVEARAFYHGERRVLVPEPFPRLCTPRVTAMERVIGRKITDRPDGEAHRLARLVVSSLIARPIFATEPNALFHGDPHAGNLFQADDGRLAPLDWSLVGRLGRAEREAMVQTIVGAVTLDPAWIARSLAGLSHRGEVDADALRRIAERSLRVLREGRLPGSAWLTTLLDDATIHAHLRVSGDLILFRKTLHTLEGVLNDIGGRADDLIDSRLMSGFLEQLTREWPGRWITRPESRDFATRLSNADLASLWLSLPLTAWRFWIGKANDLIEPRGERDA